MKVSTPADERRIRHDLLGVPMKPKSSSSSRL
jgi:hypothetical protein